MVELKCEVDVWVMMLHSSMKACVLPFPATLLYMVRTPNMVHEAYPLNIAMMCTKGIKRARFPNANLDCLLGS